MDDLDNFGFDSSDGSDFSLPIDDILESPKTAKVSGNSKVKENKKNTLSVKNYSTGTEKAVGKSVKFKGTEDNDDIGLLPKDSNDFAINSIKDKISISDDFKKINEIDKTGTSQDFKSNKGRSMLSDLLDTHKQHNVDRSVPFNERNRHDRVVELAVKSPLQESAIFSNVPDQMTLHSSEMNLGKNTDSNQEIPQSKRKMRSILDDLLNPDDTSYTDKKISDNSPDRNKVAQNDFSSSFIKSQETRRKYSSMNDPLGIFSSPEKEFIPTKSENLIKSLPITQKSNKSLSILQDSEINEKENWHTSTSLKHDDQVFDTEGNLKTEPISHLLIHNDIENLPNKMLDSHIKYKGTDNVFNSFISEDYEKPGGAKPSTDVLPLWLSETHKKKSDVQHQTSHPVEHINLKQRDIVGIGSDDREMGKSKSSQLPPPPQIDLSVQQQEMQFKQLIQLQEKLSEMQLQSQQEQWEQQKKMESEILQKEKMLLKNMVENLQKQHLEEVQLIHESYRKQINILEEMVQKQEARFHSESERIEMEYEEKIKKLKESTKKLIEEHNNHLGSIYDQHNEELHLLRQQHSVLLRSVQPVHKHVPSIKTFSNNARVLKEAVQQLDQNTKNLTNFQTTLEDQKQMQFIQLESALKTKETELKVAHASMEKERKVAEQERRHIINLMNKLEIKLTEERHLIEEERWNLQQQTMTLNARMESFEKERSRLLTSLEREKQYIFNLKQSALQEQQAAKEKLEEEKLRISAEKARVEALTELYGPGTNRADKEIKAEAEAVIKAARNAIEKADFERKKLLDQQLALENEKWRLKELEQTLSSQLAQVENSAKMTHLAKQENLRILQEIKNLETLQLNRMNDIQQQMADLTSREKKLFEEKILLSQERLRTKQGEKPHLGPMQQKQKGKPLKSYILQDTNKVQGIIDPQSVIKKLAAEQEHASLGKRSYFFND